MNLSWIRVDVGLPRHEKSDLLEAALGERRAWSYVVELWTWAAENRADGDLTGLPDSIIARRAGYEGDAARFVAALIECGWLTADRVLYKWEHRQGARAEKAERDAERKRDMRRADGARTARGQRSDGAGNGTRRNETERNETQDREGVPAADVDAPTPSASAAPPAPHPISQPKFDRPEPLGPYGETMPKAVDEVLAYVDDGVTLRERWLKAVPEFDTERLEREVRAAMNHRLTLDGPRFARWFWPGGFINAVDGWLRRARKDELDLIAAEKRAKTAATRAGEHVSAPAEESADERKRKQLAKIAEHQRAKAEGRA